MKIELVDHHQNILETIDVEFNCFKKGEKVHISIKNDFTETWPNVKPYFAKFIVHDIEHFVETIFPNTKTGEIKEKMITSVILHEILEPNTKVLADGKETTVIKITDFGNEPHYRLKGDSGLWHISELEILR